MSGIGEVDHNQRAERVGASDVAAICGLSPWGNSLTVWMDKTKRSTPRQPTNPMIWGHLFEAPIATWYEDKTGREVVERQKDFRGESSHHGALLDGIARRALEADRVWEAKSSGDKPWDEIPYPYQIQPQWQMHVTGLEVCDLVCLHLPYGRPDPRIYRIERDEGIIRRLVEKVDRFWNLHVLTDTPPPVMDGMKVTADALATLYPRDNELTVEIGQDRYDRITAAKASMKTATDAYKFEENALKQDMKHGGTAVTPDGRRAATWLENDVTRLDSKGIKKDHPDLVEEYSATKTQARFLLKDQK